jgi:hypothetical protein
LKKSGDVYIHCKPLEDYRALYWTNKRLNSKDYVTPGAPSFVYNYLAGSERHYGINYLIECMAFIKYLNQHYDRVILLGCSQGGYAALILSLISHVDGALIAAGYSVKLQDFSLGMFGFKQNFGDTLVNKYDSATIKNKLIQSTKRFLFTYGNLEDSFWQQEHDSAYTEKYFNHYQNIQYYYNFNYHAFPPCDIIDSFSYHTHQIPKIILKVHEQLSSDSVMLQARVIGKGPISADLYRDSILLNSYNILPDTLTFLATDSGKYYFANIISHDSVKGHSFDTIYFNKIQYPVKIKDVLFEEITVSHSNKQLFIHYPNIDQVTNMSIYSMNGQKLSETKIKHPHTYYNTDALPPGIYFIQFINAKGKFNKKILIQ